MLKETILFVREIYSIALTTVFLISNLIKAFLFLTLLLNSIFQLKGKKDFYVPIQIAQTQYFSKFDKLCDLYTNEIFNLSFTKIKTGYYLNLKKKIKTFGLNDLTLYFLKLNRIVFCVDLFIIIKNEYHPFDYFFYLKYNCNDERLFFRYKGV